MDGYGGTPGAMPMGQPGIRPKVDPEALGEVDPNLYPQPKEATHKIRGRSDILELLCGDVDQELLTVKTFYFFFYSAFGSLFPLMGVYFKQMGMNPGQCGLLIGSRPFVEFLAAPFWGSLADRWQKGKILLLASLSCWIIFTLPLGFIQPPATSCLVKKNHTEYVLETPKVPRILKREAPEWAEPQLPTPLSISTRTNEHNTLKRDVLPWIEPEIPIPMVEEEEPLVRNIRSAKPHVYAGQSPLDIRFVKNYNEKEQGNWVSPIFSSIVYRTQIPEVPKHNRTSKGKNATEYPVSPGITIILPGRFFIVKDIQKAFFLLLLLVVIGEFFSAPAITLADSAVITLLGEDADRYGHQRMFGSLGWGLAMFFVGIALDHSTAFPDHPCGPDEREKNYTICFATFSVLMGAALICATQINFKYEFSTGSEMEKPPPEPTREDYLQQELAQQLNLPALATNSINAPPPPATSKTQMFAQTTREIPEWVTVLKYFANVKCGSFLFVSWFMGFGIGLIFTFLFWHLQDYGGSPTLFGVASVINHISEIFAYFFSFRLITQMGHVKVLCLGLAGNVLRFLYISYLKNPWWVLPFEFMQGITHAAVWAACCSYIAHNTPQHLRSSAQGVLQGIHHGLGRGCGAVFGGMFVTYFGTTATFRGYGLCCAVVLAAFIFINFYRIDTGFVSELPVTEDPHQVAEETAHLAPHGVPSNPIPRALSSSRLHDMASEPGYGAYQLVVAEETSHLVPHGVPSNPIPRALSSSRLHDMASVPGYGANQQVAEETAHLAPHGVPSNPIPRALSSSRLHDMASEPGYGATYNTTGGNLDIPGAGGNMGGGGSTNPFRQYSDYNNYETSNQTISEEDSIRRHFQMYSEVLAQYEGLQAKAPTLTSLHPQQPEGNSQLSYEW